MRLVPPRGLAFDSDHTLPMVGGLAVIHGNFLYTYECAIDAILSMDVRLGDQTSRAAFGAFAHTLPADRGGETRQAAVMFSDYRASAM